MRIAILFFFVLCGCTNYKYYGEPAKPPAFDCDCGTTYEKVFEGSFQNKNQYMQNPYVNCTDSVTRFATVSVTINDTMLMKFDDINSNAFEIPLKEYNFKVGDPIRIVVKHYGCGAPRMLNPEVY